MMAPSHKWTIATARAQLTRVVAASAREPQAIYRRNKLVAAVVAPSAMVAQRPSLADKLAELRQICAEEGVELPVPVRADRVNAFGARAPRKRRSRT